MLNTKQDAAKNSASLEFLKKLLDVRALSLQVKCSEFLPCLGPAASATLPYPAFSSI